MRSARTSRALFVLATFASMGVASVVAIAPRPARADTVVKPKDRARAGDLFKRSAGAYRRGDYKRAADLLTQAYAIDPQPVLLYNLGRAREKMGDVDGAIDAYERYLAQDPKAHDRAAVEHRLTALRQKRDAAAKLREPAPPPAPPPPDPAPPPPAPPVAVSASASPPPAPPADPSPPVATPPPAMDEPMPVRRTNAVPLVIAGAGVVGVGVGVALGVMASSKETSANAEPTQLRAAELESQGEHLATASTIAFVVGGALLAGGASWYLIDVSSKHDTGLAPTRVRVGLGPGALRFEAVLP